MASPQDGAVSRAVDFLRTARRVLQRYHDDEGTSFQEEPSLTDILLVAQLLGQSSAMENLGTLGRSIEEGTLGHGVSKKVAPAPAPAPSGDQFIGEAVGIPPGPPTIAFPETDLVVHWDPTYRAWHVLVNPLIGTPVYCANPQQLSDTLRDLQAKVAQFRASHF